jgi:hypothetical protein
MQNRTIAPMAPNGGRGQTGIRGIDGVRLLALCVSHDEDNLIHRTYMRPTATSAASPL